MTAAIDDADDPRAAEDASIEGDSSDEGRVLQVHMGPSANCSSIGSFVDFLFVSGVVGGAVLSAVAVLLKQRADADAAAEAGDAESKPENDDAEADAADPE